MSCVKMYFLDDLLESHYFKSLYDPLFEILHTSLNTKNWKRCYERMFQKVFAIECTINFGNEGEI